MDPLNWIDDGLRGLRQQDLLRTLPPALGAAGVVAEYESRRYLNFASNDYLGLAAEPRLVEAAVQASQSEGVGRGASPLICGRGSWHERLETRLAEFERTEAALLFPSGFAANTGVIPALVDKGDVVYSDAHNHASIVDGCRLSRATRQVYPHNDTEALEQLLRAGNPYRRRLIVTDTLFSMDGDFAPLGRLGELAETYDAMLMVDEAHATGVFGTHGRGLVEHFTERHPRLHQQVHIRVGTLSKALGSAGGFVCGSQSLIDWLTNRARSYVFSTAHPAAASAAAIAALEIVETEPERRTRLAALSEHVRSGLRDQGWQLGPTTSQIIPVRIGSAAKTMELAAKLRERGIWVGGIRPPSVAENESLLRIGLSAAHTDEMIQQLLDALADLRTLLPDADRAQCNDSPDTKSPATRPYTGSIPQS